LVHLVLILGYSVDFLQAHAYYYTVISAFTFFGLALFFFISGFVINLNNSSMQTRADILKFYKKRAKRIYPLYWLAISLPLVYRLFLANLLPTVHSLIAASSLTIPTISASSVFVNFLGFQVLLGSTVEIPMGADTVAINWFVGVILIYYALYPVIVVLSLNKVQRTIIVALSLLLFFALYSIFLSPMDFRFFLYYPIFIAGIILSRAGIFDKLHSKRYVIGSAGVLTVSVLLYFIVTDFNLTFSEPVTAVASILFVDSVVIALILLSLVITPHYSKDLGERAVKLASFIAFSSYAVFLFHDMFLVVFRNLLNEVFHLGFAATATLVILCGVPLLFVTCYYLQRGVNRLVDKSALLLTIISPAWKRFKSIFSSF
jgi:peptidoglycan/LPS O-acetylase OafA/YrhL